MKTLTLTTLALLVNSCATWAIDIPQQGKAELIFINLWDEYAEPIKLPQPTDNIKRVLLQPDFNVNAGAINDFVGYYPQFEGLEIDTQQTLALKYKIWQTPTRVLLNNGKVESITPLRTLSDANVSHENIINNVAKKSDTFALTKPDGSTASLTLNGKKQVLFFSDALCPFQHLPNCEEKIKQNNGLIEQTTLPVTTIVKPFYITNHEVKSYQQRFHVNHPIFMDSTNSLFQKFEITSLPYWLVINEKGNPTYRGEKPPTFF